MPVLNWKLFVSTFALIFTSELPDKTAMATLLLAARGRPYAVFVGVAAAFTVQSVVAVTCGSLLGLLPQHWVHLGAGLVFLAFAAAAWRRSMSKSENENDESLDGKLKKSFGTTAWKAFVIIFIAEWGDLTQLATASLVARTRDVATVFLAATSALWACTAVVIAVGTRLSRVLSPRMLNRVAAITFAAVGAYFIVSAVSEGLSARSAASTNAPEAIIQSSGSQ